MPRLLALLLAPPLIACSGGVAIFVLPPGPAEDDAGLARINAEIGDAGATSINAADAAPSSDAGPVDKGTLYVALCQTSPVDTEKDPHLRFYVHIKASGGVRSLTMTPMVGWDLAARHAIQPATVAIGETRGATVTATFPANEDVFTATFPGIDIPAEASQIGVLMHIDGITIRGRFPYNDFCSTLSGQVTVPYKVAMTPDANICLFVSANEGDPLPVRVASNFHCTP